MKPLRLSLHEPILVPVDFSPCSRCALDYATALAKTAQTTILLLHVVQLYPLDYLLGRNTQPEQSRLLRAYAQRSLNLWVRRCAPAGAPRVQTLVSLGNPFREILKTAAQYQVQLIVMGTHGYTSLQPIELGSTAQHIVRLAPCPVLLVPAPLQAFVWADRRVVQPSNQPPVALSL